MNLTKPRILLAALVTAVLALGLSVAVSPTRASALTKQEAIATLAFANVGKKACSTNSKGGKGYYKSCTGYGGGPEYWCADFAKWVWAQNGVKDTGVLSAAAYSFYTYGKKYGGIHKVPKLGDVAIFTATKNDLTWSDHGISHVASSAAGATAANRCTRFPATGTTTRPATNR